MMSLILNLTDSSAFTPSTFIPSNILIILSFSFSLISCYIPPIKLTHYGSSFHDGTSGMVFITETSNSFLLIEERTHCQGRWGQNFLSVSCTVVITGRQIIWLPGLLRRVMRVLFLIGVLHLNVSFYHRSGTVEVTQGIKVCWYCQSFIHRQMKLHRAQ